MIQVFAFYHKHIRMARLLVGPEVAEHLLTVTEARHPPFPCLGYGGVLAKNDTAQCEQAAFDRLLLFKIVLIAFLYHGA